MSRALFIVFLQLEANVFASSPHLGSCATVKRQIGEHGAQKVLDSMWANDERLFLKLLPHIAAAEPCWLEVADLLKTVADAGASEELESAMSRALTSHPERALPYLSAEGRFPISLVCSGSQVGVDETEAGFRQWLKRTRTAVESVKLPSELEAKRQHCLTEIAKEESRLR